MQDKLINLEGDISNHLAALKYTQLRTIAKQYSIKANQKKEVLIKELLKAFECRDLNKENIDSKNSLESRDLSKENINSKNSLESRDLSKENTNSNNSIDTKKVSSQPRDNLLNVTSSHVFHAEKYNNVLKSCIINSSDKNKILVENSKRNSYDDTSDNLLNVTSSHMSHVEEYNNVIKSCIINPSDKNKILGENSQQNSYENTSESKSNSIVNCDKEGSRNNDTSMPFKPATSIVARFAALHQKLIEKQPTLQESDAKVKRKFVEHEKAVPEIFKRLATSKKPESKVIIKARSPGYRFKNVGEDPLKINYSFPKLDRIKNAPVDLQNCTKVSSQTRVMRERRIGVKELSKKFITKQVRRSPRFVKLVEAKSAVTPQLTARLKRLATPKGKTPEVSLTESEKKALVKCGRRYLPRRGRVLPYVDTTAMTDNQFYEAKRRGDIQSFTAVTRNQKRQEMLVKRKEARDQIFRSKRNY